MVKSILLFYFLIFNATNPVELPKIIQSEANTHFLICPGPSSKSFHRDYENSNLYCKGLRSCSKVPVRLVCREAIERRSVYVVKVI